MKRPNLKRRVPLIVMTVIVGLAVAACSNPLVTEMQSRITSDVETALAGPAPTLLAWSPAVDATNVRTSASVTATFDIELDEATITAANVSLLELPGETEVPGTLSYDAPSKTITFTPSSRLDVETTYRLVVGTGLRSAPGAELANQLAASFTTMFHHDDEIGLDIVYTSSDLVLNASAPLYLSVARVPFPEFNDAGDVATLTGQPITSSGTVRIPKSSIPDETSEALILIFHDIDGSGDENAGDTTRIVSFGEPGNMEDLDGAEIWALDEFDAPLIQNGYRVAQGQYVLSVGSSYSLVYTDGSPVSADGFESLDTTGPATSRELTHGTTETARNLHSLDDVDFFRFTPATTDYYEIAVGSTSSDLRVALYETDSDALNQSGALASSTGSSARTINLGGDRLDADTEYYIRVSSPSSYLGSYDIGFEFAPVAPDAYEDGDDTKSGATALPLGVGSPVTRTLDRDDYDWFEVTLEEDTSYIVTVAEDTSYFGFGLGDRGLDPSFRIEMDGSTSSTNVYRELDASTLLIDYPWAGSDTYYIRVGNDSPMIGDDKPTGQYTISLSYGPDGFDQFDDPDTLLDEYALWNELGSNYQAAAWARFGTDGHVRTIYSGEAGDTPETDVDWLSFDTEDLYDYYLIKVQPEGADDAVVVDFSVYQSMYDEADIVPDTSSPVAGSSWWSSDNTVRGGTLYPLTARSSYVDEDNPSSVETRWWIRISRDAGWSGNPLTGRYRVTVQYAPDWMDDYYNGPSETDSLVDMVDSGGAVFYTGGIDETPYLGLQNQQFPTFSSNFADRNELTWTGSIGNYEVDSFYNSIFRKNYSGDGEPDGVTDPSTDHEFFWFALPGSLADFLILGYSNSTPEIPLKLTYWELTPTEFGNAIADELVTESDLDALDIPTVVTSSYVIGEGAEKIEQTVTASAAGNYFFFKVERDDSRTTYTDSNGDLRTYAQTGGYRLMFWD